MRHRYEHHIDEEEEEMFPAAEKELDDATEQKLADIYENPQADRGKGGEGQPARR